MAALDGRKVAILATDGFEEVELTEPAKALKQAGAEVDIVSPKAGEILGFHHFDKAEWVHVDKDLEKADPRDYDALVIPGGVFNPDQLRVNEKARAFVREFMNTDKPVAAICHGPWLLIDAQVVGGRTMTSVKTIRTDLSNAGAHVVDEEVAIDGNLITSRGPKDLPAFCRALIEKVAQTPVPSGPKGLVFI